MARLEETVRQLEELADGLCPLGFGFLAFFHLFVEPVAAQCRMARLEETVRQREELADGLHLLDFEQLKIENQALHEKVEERHEELLRLRRKITSTVQVRLGACAV